MQMFTYTTILIDFQYIKKIRLQVASLILKNILLTTLFTHL